MTRRAYIVPIVALAGLGLATLGSFALTRGQATRPDCPGKIVCPQTGELVCRDRCPTVDSDRRDCPGRIVCGLTGELVCRDRCPLGVQGVTARKPQVKVPSCCVEKGSSTITQ